MMYNCSVSSQSWRQQDLLQLAAKHALDISDPLGM